MKWDARVNAALRRAGYQITRPPGHPARKMAPPEGRRLLTAPVIVLSPARAGSTLLRMILDSHSALYAPPELPLAQLAVQAETAWIRASLEELQLTAQEVTYLLWDRVVANALSRSGKPTVVLKTPSNVLVWRQIAARQKSLLEVRWCARLERLRARRLIAAAASRLVRHQVDRKSVV